MNTIHERYLEQNLWRETLHGHEDFSRAVEQMALLCGEEIKAIQSRGRRATLDAGCWDGRLVFRVLGGHDNVLHSYSLIIK